jgi:hypothetical protein
MSNAFCSGSKRFFNYVFVKHPEEQNMTYFQHLKHACCYSVQALGCSLVFMVHGIVPCLFEKTGSIMVKRLHDRLNGAKHHEHEDEKKNQD